MIEPGSLMSKAAAKYQEALRSGALRSYSTDLCLVKDEEIDYIAFVLKELTEEEKYWWEHNKHSSTEKKKQDPFLPYEKELFVADVSETHVCLLNKYNVLQNHLLIVTRQFEEQESLLTRADFEALWLCLKEINGLAFYNSGEKAGASQRHKHLQIVKLPLGGNGPGIPIEPLIRKLEIQSGIIRIPQFAFRHGLVFIPDGMSSNQEGMIGFLYDSYKALLKWTGLSGQSQPYNLLITAGWLIFIPRKKEKFENISVNSLGFAGALLVKDRQELEIVKNERFLNILQSVSMS